MTFAERAISQMRSQREIQSVPPTRLELQIYLSEIEEAVACLEDALNTIQYEQGEVLRALRELR